MIARDRDRLVMIRRHKVMMEPPSSGMAARLRVILVACILVTLSLPGCGDGVGAGPRTQEALARSLRDRATEFWQTRVDMPRLYDDEKAYDELLARQFDFWDPEFKKQVRLSEYRASRGSAVYESAEVLKAEVDGDVGWVDVKYTWRMANPPAGMTSESTRTETTLTDREWLLVDGVWYKKYDPKRAMGRGPTRSSRSSGSEESEQENTKTPALSPGHPSGEGN